MKYIRHNASWIVLSKMKLPYHVDLIVFDLDGTLIDSREDLANSANYVLNRLGLEELSVEILSSFIGDGVYKLVERALDWQTSPGRAYPGSVDEAVELFRAHYAEHLVDRTRLYPGVLETLNHFQGKKKAVVTNKPFDFAMSILNNLGIVEHFDVVLGGDSTTNRKPDPEPLEEVLTRLRILKERAVIVGDSPQDIEMARRAGLLSIAVTYGLGQREELIKAEPDLFIEKLYDLANYLS